MASELGSSQISTLLETLPGIAHVLRSPVADALVGIIRSGARIGDFQLAHVEELLKYATRRGLLGNDEADQLLADIKSAEQKRADKAADRVKAQAQKVKPAKSTTAKAHKPAKVASKAVKPVKKLVKAAKKR